MTSENNIIIKHIQQVLNQQERPQLISKGMGNLIRMPALPLKITSNSLCKNSHRSTFDQSQRIETKQEKKSQREQIAKITYQKINLKKQLSDITQFIPQQPDQDLQKLPKSQCIALKNSFMTSQIKEYESYQGDDTTQNQSKFITENGGDLSKQLEEHKKNLSSITAAPTHRNYQSPNKKFLPLPPQKSQMLEISYLKYPKLMLKELYTLRNKSLKGSKFSNDGENSEFFIQSKSFGINVRPNRHQAFEMITQFDQRKSISAVKSIFPQKEHVSNPTEIINSKSNRDIQKFTKKKYKRNVEDVMRDIEIDLDYREKDQKKCFKNLLQRNILVQQTINDWQKRFR